MLLITVWSQHGVSLGGIGHDLHTRQTRQSREKLLVEKKLHVAVKLYQKYFPKVSSNWQ